MSSFADREHSHPPDNERGLCNAGGFLVMAVIVGAALLPLEFNHELEIVSAPLLQDLVGAQSHSSRSYGAERNLLADPRTAHRELSGATRQLTAAELQHPAGSMQIDAVRNRLEALEHAGSAEKATLEELDTRYRRLGSEIEGMIDARLDRGR